MQWWVMTAESLGRVELLTGQKMKELGQLSEFYGCGSIGLVLLLLRTYIPVLIIPKFMSIPTPIKNHVIFLWMLLRKHEQD